MNASKKSKVIIIGQAPGSKVHASGIPWNDKSGENLRSWLGINDSQFYDPTIFCILPMGFCYPGKGKSGDLPPRPECAPMWHQKVLDQIEKPGLMLLIGQYAQKYYLGEKSKPTLTQTVQSFKDYLDSGFLPLPHPSPRNNIWMKKNPWFEGELLPVLKKEIERAIGR
jgi:uracil-DNA glycosylase